MSPADPRARLVLASASPRRRRLLASLGLDFTVRPVDLDETRLPGEEPAVYVERLARAKAEAEARPGELVLAADTVVVIADAVLGKPDGPAEARAMLARLAGRWHRVLTGVAAYDPAAGRIEVAVETTRVLMAPMTAAEVAWYAATGEPLDKAGSYAIQGRGALFVEAIEGNYTNVVGLPLPATRRLLTGLGSDLRELGAVSEQAAVRPRT